MTGLRHRYYIQANRIWNAVTSNFSKDTLRLASPFFGNCCAIFCGSSFDLFSSTTCCRCLCTKEDIPRSSVPVHVLCLSIESRFTRRNFLSSILALRIFCLAEFLVVIRRTKLNTASTDTFDGLASISTERTEFVVFVA